MSEPIALELIKKKISEFSEEFESNITEETPLDYYEEHVWDIIDWFESEYGIVIQSDRIFTEIQTVGELTTYLKDLVDGKRY